MQSEDSIQEAVAKWWGFACKGFGLDYRCLHHSPNGGTRHVREAVKFKRMGTRNGFPDLFIMVPRAETSAVRGARQSYAGLFIELKSEKGRLSPEQREYHPILEAQGYCVMTAWSFDEAVTYITNYLTHGGAFAKKP